jgi:hypothetical protein
MNSPRAFEWIHIEYLNKFTESIWINSKRVYQCCHQLGSSLVGVAIMGLASWSSHRGVVERRPVAWRAQVKEEVYTWRLVWGRRAQGCHRSGSPSRVMRGWGCGYIACRGSQSSEIRVLRVGGAAFYKSNHSRNGHWGHHICLLLLGGQYQWALDDVTVPIDTKDHTNNGQWHHSLSLMWPIIATDEVTSSNAYWYCDRWVAAAGIRVTSLALVATVVTAVTSAVVTSPWHHYSNRSQGAHYYSGHPLSLLLKAYYKKVKLKSFHVGALVWKTILPIGFCRGLWLVSRVAVLMNVENNGNTRGTRV